MTIPSEAWIALIGVLAGSGLTGAVSILITKINQAHEMNKMQAQQRRFYDELNHKRRMECMEHSNDILSKLIFASSVIRDPSEDPQEEAVREFQEASLNFLRDRPKANLFLGKDEIESHNKVMDALQHFWENRNSETFKALCESSVILTLKYRRSLGIESTIPETLSTLYPGGIEEFASLLEKRHDPRESGREADI